MGNCSPLTPDAYKVIVRVPLVSPYAFRWMLGNDPRDDVSDTITYVRDPSTVGKLGLNGAVIHQGTERLFANPASGKYHHVSVSVDGEVAYPLSVEELQPPQVQSVGNRSSLLKARITLDLGNARRRTIDFDIGAGVEFTVSCYSISSLEVLIPDPRVEIPNELGPQGDQGPFQLATVLTSTIYFTQWSSGPKNPLTYTVPLSFGGTITEAFVPRAADSVLVTAGTTPGSAVSVDFLYVPPGFREVAYAAPTSYYILDSVTLLPGQSRLQETTIPGNTNAYRVRGDSFVNIVQILNT